MVRISAGSSKARSASYEAVDLDVIDSHASSFADIQAQLNDDLPYPTSGSTVHTGDPSVSLSSTQFSKETRRSGFLARRKSNSNSIKYGTQQGLLDSQNGNHDDDELENGRSNGHTKVPPAASFMKHNSARGKLPSYRIPNSKRARDQQGRHQRLATDEDDVNSSSVRRDRPTEFAYSDDEDNLSYDEDNDDTVKRSNKIRSKLMKNPINGIHDPAEFPLEQYTDAEYGVPSKTSASAFNPPPTNGDDKKSRDASDRACLSFGAFVAIFFCFILIIVAATTTPEKKIVIKVPPLDIEDICSITNISTQKGLGECESICKRATCCMLGGKDSCFLDQEDICGLYSACGVLHDQVEGDDIGTEEAPDDFAVPPAPYNIGSLCSDSSIITSSGYLSCLSSCNEGACCFLNMDNKLGLDATPYQMKPCYETHEDICSNYTPCLSLEGTGGAHGNPVTLVNSRCSASNVKYAEGREDCENACQTRSCCFTKSSKGNCRADNMNWCNEFKACEILYTSSPTNNDSGGSSNLSVEDKCKLVSDVNSPDFSLCQNVCEPSECCFYDDANCGDGIICKYYEFCKGIFILSDFQNSDANTNGGGDNSVDLTNNPDGSDTSIGPLVSQVAEACKDISTQSKEDECNFLCSDYICCFYDEYSPDACHSQSTCDKYNICSILLSENTGSSGTNTASTNGSGGSNINITPNEVCDISHLATPGGVNDCEDSCKDHMCCFSIAFDSCATSNPSCSDYSACGLLMNDDIIIEDSNGLRKFDVDAACSEDSLNSIQGKNLCYMICNLQKCCFEDGGCPDDTSNHCDNFGACANLFDKESADKNNDYDPPSLNFDDYCTFELLTSDDEFYLSECLDMCSEAECCHDESCIHKTSFCKLYSKCYMVWEIDDYNNSSGSTGDTNSVSNSGSITNSGANNQTTNNNSNTSVGPGSTSNNTGTDGGPFTDLGPMSTALDPAVSCEASQIVSAAGKALCEKACTPYKCCWDYNCTEKQVECSVMMKLCPTNGKFQN